MRTIIAGSRRGVSAADVSAALHCCGWTPSVVLSGQAEGADRLGEAWAQARGIPVELYPADWRHLGYRAGHARNQTMANQADALVAVWNFQSPGTRDMIRRARARGLRTFVWPVPFPTVGSTQPQRLPAL